MSKYENIPSGYWIFGGKASEDVWVHIPRRPVALRLLPWLLVAALIGLASVMIPWIMGASLP